MMKNYLIKILVPLLVLLATAITAQTNIAIQSFEGSGSWTFTESPASYNDGEDTWAIVNSLPTISAADDGTLFWGMRDLKNPITNPPNGTTGSNVDHILTFPNQSVNGQSSVILRLSYYSNGFDSGDELSYVVVLDNVDQTEVFLDKDTDAWTEVEIPVADAVNNVGLRLIASQDGGVDYAGWDAISLTADNPGDPCGISALSSPTENCLTIDAASNTDLYSVDITVDGTDADASLTGTVDGSPATFTITGGSLSSGPDGRTITVESPSLVEGTSYVIGLADGGGDCANLSSVSGSVTDNECRPICDITLPSSDIFFFCDGLSSETNDAITVVLDYGGSGINVDAQIGTKDGGGSFTPAVTVTDAFQTSDGEVTITGLTEGNADYFVRFVGSGCNQERGPFTVTESFCQASSLIINEVLYDPPLSMIGDQPDPNNDGNFDGSEDEFVEIFNTSENPISVGGFVLTDSDNQSVFTFPAGAQVPANSAVVVFGGGAPDLDCPTFTRGSPATLALTNTGSERVILKNGSNETVAQMSYAGGGNSVDESLARNSGGSYVDQTSLISGVNYTPCQDNIDQSSLPITLLTFQATPTPKSIDLTWTTTEEINNDHFEIQRSYDGRTFAPVGTLPAFRDTDAAAINEYNFTDRSPLTGTSYYRLRQVDFDGTATLYGPLAVDFRTEALALFPNPASHTITLTRVPAQLQLLSAEGRLLRELPASNTVDVADLLPGIYYLRVQTENDTQALRFAKR